MLTNKVHRVLGLNPSTFTGPGTNTYLVGMDGGTPLLMDTGSGVPAYVDLLKGHVKAHTLAPLSQIIMTHAHGDHIGGAADVEKLYPKIRMSKCPWPERDALFPVELAALKDGDRVKGEGYTLRAVFTPGHAPDHLCYLLEEENAL
ncbi:MAG TPA: MBL fold metallo-hydrolase, partial [bacterium]